MYEQDLQNVKNRQTSIVIALCRIARKYIALKAGLKNVVVFAGPAKFCS